MGRVPNFRKAVWHWRKGGTRQLKLYLRRNALDLPDNTAKTRDVAQFDAFEIPLLSPRRAIRVGIIADSFTDMAFSYEWDQVHLTKENWSNEIDGIELLFVEAAWHGNNDEWQYQLVGSRSPSDAVRELVKACKERGIPTVFWNKEDPFHYSDFLNTARLFDWVYTTEEELVEVYKEELGHSNVDLLTFGAQPIIHNPGSRAADEELRDVCFAGTYFQHKFPERQQQIRTLLGGALDADSKLPKGVDIFARFNGVDPNYEFPDEFKPFIRGELSYPQMLRAYRSYKCFINANSVPDSQTMFSRRVFEIVACGGAVISAPSPAIERIFGQSVVQVRTRDAARNWVRALSNSKALRDELAYEGRMRVYENHTYSHRVDKILRDVGLERFVLGGCRVSIMAATTRPNQIRHMLDQFAKQRGVEMQIMICPNGFVPTDADKAYAKSLGLGVEWLDLPSGLHLGDYYNEMIDLAVHPYVAKMDDDDTYGPYYLLEQLTAAESTGADVVGKESHFVNLNVNGTSRMAVTFPQRQHRFTTFVSGPTLVIRTEVAKRIRFESRTRGEDTSFLHNVIAAGGKIWSTGRYGFIQNRLGLNHTWSIGSEEILAYSVLLEEGDGPGISED